MRLSPTFGRSPGSFSPAANFTPTRQGDAMNLDESSSNLLNAHSSSNTPSVGTPIRLAPSTSAFRQSTIGSLPAVKLNAQQSHGGMSQTPFNLNVNSSAQQQPNKGLVGQAVDLIFGWWCVMDNTLYKFFNHAYIHVRLLDEKINDYCI